MAPSLSPRKDSQRPHPKSTVVRRLLVVLFVLLACPLIAAGPPDLSVKPNVVVYPFTANGSTLDREASSRLATIIATEMANTGKVTVIPPTPGTERKDYLTAARAVGADYYIAGFISPLGNGVSMVEQVVGVTSGIIVYSNTGQLTTYADAAGQGDQLASFVSQYANRGLAAIGTPPPASSPTPAPASSGGANLSALGKLFGRHRGTQAASPTPKPIISPTPIPTPAGAASVPLTSPPPVVRTMVPRPLASPTAAATAVIPVTGTAAAELRTYATQHVAEIANADQADTAAAACQVSRSRTVLAGVLSFRPDTTGGGSANFELIASNCRGKVSWRKSFTEAATGTQGSQLATQRAVEAALAAYLNPSHTRRG
jgi:TolB-like protein